VRSATRRSAVALFTVALLLSALPLRAALATTAPTPGANPDLAASCGADISLVIDRSGSIDDDNVDVQAAAQTFVDALVGTGSKVQVVSFSTTATAEPGAHAALSGLAFVDPATLTVPLFTSSGYTNWDDALEMVRRSPAGHAPLTVMITDGDPTERNTNQPDGHGGGVVPADGSTRPADLDAAVSEANALKALPSHVFVVGVGNAVSNATSEGRIKAVSGPDKLTFSGETPNISFGSADYTLVSSFTALETTVARFVRELCGPSLNVVKKLQMADGSTVDAGATDSFTFSATLDPPASAWHNPAQPAGANATLTTTDGTANFAFDPSTPLAASTITLDEAAKAGWVENGIKCWINNLDGTPATVVLDDVGANVVGASKPSTPRVLPAVGAYQAMNCEVYNRQVRPASIGVDKVTSPSGLPDAFAFSLEQGATTVGSIASLTHADAAAVFPPVAPGTYDVVEAPSAHFSQTAATCDDLGTQATEAASPVGLTVAESAHWQCKFTNTLHNGTITIVKDLNGAPSGSFGFTSNVPGHTAFTLQPTAGTNASTSFSVPAGTYAVAEGGHAPYALGAVCTTGSTPAAIVVTADATTTCTFTNTAPAPSITVTKAAGVPTVAEPGGDVTYTVTVTNTSVEPLTLTSLSDVVGGSTIDVFELSAARTTCLPLHNATIAAGATVGCTFLAPVAGNAGATVTDTVTAHAVDADGTEASNEATAGVGITNVAPTIMVTKSALTPTLPEPGGPVVYEVTVENTSDEAVSLTSLTDQVGAGPVLNLTAAAGPITQTDCALGPIAAGATITCRFTIGVSGNAGATVTDTVKAVAVDDDQSTAQSQDDATVLLTDVLPSITVTKDANKETVAEPGSTVTFTVGITNDTAEAVVLTSISDQVGAAAPFAVTGTCDDLVGTTLAPHASTTCTFSLPVSGNAGATLVDTVTVAAHDDDENTTTGADTASVGVTDVQPTITVTKTPAPSSVPEPGGDVTFTVDITNTTVETLTIDAIVDAVGGGTPVDLATIPGTCDDTIGTSLAAGASTGCTFVLFVAGNAADVVHDEVTVSAGDDDGNQATETAAADVTITDVKPTITVTKTAGAPSVSEPGGPVTYTITVTNTSPEAVTLTELSDVVGAGPAFDVTGVDGTTCDLPQAIPVAEDYTCTFTVDVAGNAGDAVSDTVTATAVDDEDNTATDEGTATVSILDVTPAISVTKTPGVASLPEPGGPVTYSVGIANLTDEAVVIDSIDDAIGDADPIAAGGTCADLLGTSLAPHAETTCTFSAPALGNAGDDVTDTVTVRASDDEENEATDEADATVGISDVLPTISVVKDATTGSVSAPGGSATFTVTVTNTSPEPVTIESIVDEVDGTSLDVTEVAGPVTATTCETGVELATAGTDGDTYVCEFTLTITATEAAEVTDVVTVVVSDDDDNSATEDDDATTTVAVSADLAIAKVTSTVPTVGQTGTYTLTVTNTGPSTAVDVTVTDPLPSPMTATSATGAGWDCTISAGGSSVSCDRDSLASGATAAIVVQVAVGDPGEGVSVTNTATVGSPTPDPDLTNNTSSVTDLPLRVLDAFFVPPVADATPLPETGVDLAPWLIVADLLLILGVLALLGEPMVRFRRDG
jgi:uncharacterized repeat protein (TIGR01451 family)